MSQIREGDFVEFGDKRLCWFVNTAPLVPLHDTEDAHFFSVDDVLQYQAYVSDFGPLDIGMTHWYIKALLKKLKNPKFAGKRIIHVCADDEEKRANSAYLICAYFVVVHGVPAAEAFQPFEEAMVQFVPFRDASRGESTWTLSIIDCLRGLEAGIRLGWYDFQSFNLEDYVRYQQIENGDMNWIIPGKFLAMTGPAMTPPCTPLDLVPTLRAKGVQAVVRLNKKEYDEEDFKQNGIMHFDLFFEDGSCPSARIINNFLGIVEKVKGAIAVHCKAGLGRTATLIGLCAMMQHGLTAREFIAWSRLCRPGSVIGPQQQFLSDMQEGMFRLRSVSACPPTAMPSFDSRARARVKAARGYKDEGQGEQLCRAKQQPWNLKDRFSGS